MKNTQSIQNTKTRPNVLDVLPSELRQEIIMMSLEPVVKSATNIRKLAKPLCQSSLNVAMDTVYVLELLNSKRAKFPPKKKSDRRDARFLVHNQNDNTLTPLSGSWDYTNKESSYQHELQQLTWEIALYEAKTMVDQHLTTHQSRSSLTYNAAMARASHIRRCLSDIHSDNIRHATVVCPIVPHDHSSGYRRCPHVQEHTSAIIPSSLRATARTFVPDAKGHVMGNEICSSISCKRTWITKAWMEAEKWIWENEDRPAEEAELPQYRVARRGRRRYATSMLDQ